MNSLKEVGNRIRTARQSLNMTQADLAEKAQVSEAYISNIEMGKVHYGIDIFMRITEALQVSSDELLQTDVPATNLYISKEVEKILADCNATERKCILKVIQDVKEVFSEIKKQDNL